MQAKRTNVGIALITSPRVLFLDEPTSGLDSFTANEVMAVVKLLVRDHSCLGLMASATSAQSCNGNLCGASAHHTWMASIMNAPILHASLLFYLLDRFLTFKDLCRSMSDWSMLAAEVDDMASLLWKGSACLQWPDASARHVPDVLPSSCHSMMPSSLAEWHC